ncbi:monocarboxylate transporter 9 isoform X2 [Dendroctonus ponderosae]|nr:monocarboxylate transporter 9 isoform X2 [Dendroctonus ponderosae]XP_048517616.1 monocarboxylate transporter 9 isoform X2 [Dendroctonus ponderosae]
MNANEKNSKETYYPDGGYGWVIVGAIILINLSLLTLVPCFGLIFGDEFEAWRVTSAQTSFLLHLHSSLYCSLGFFTSPFLKLYGMRPVAFFGAGMMCLGILLSSFATSYIYLIFSTSILIGLGQGIVMPATYLGTYMYFKKRLTIAVSLTVTSASLSSIVLPKICDVLLNQVGRRYTVMLLFFISLLSFIGCFLLKPVRQRKGQMVDQDVETRLKEHEAVINGDVDKNEVACELLETKQNSIFRDTTVPATKPTSIWSKLFDVFDLQLLHDAPLVIMIIGLGVSFAAELNIILMMQFMLKDLSLFSRSDVATAILIQSVADIAGRLLIPIGAHYCKVPAKNMYVGALVVATFARTVLSIWPTEKQVVFAVITLIGLTKGTRAVFQSVVLPQYVHLDKIAAANGINMFFTGFISLVIGPLIGVIHDKMGSSVYALHAASILSTACVIMWIVEYVFWERRKSATIES